ncbi:CPBP family glutamic-type intramembrane protease [Streptomyces sp. SID1121]|uniref:CPBP family glutamic-type intramembrane protease n=1 Tax=Streptomyces sp. SID1121 TaxID=3425888 RepID=UPI004057272C
MGAEARIGVSPAGTTAALRDLCGLLVIAQWESVVGSLLYLGTLLGLPGDHPVQKMSTGVEMLNAVVLFFWLNRRVKGRRTVLRWGAAGVGLLAILVNTPGIPAGPSSFLLSSLVYPGALVWLTVELCRRHGVTLAGLGIAPPRSRTLEGRTRAWQFIYLATLACWVSADFGMNFLTNLVRQMGLELPVMQAEQAEVVGVTGPWHLMTGTIRAIVLEDLIIVGAVTVLLTAARRPAWQIYTLSALLTVAIHSYFGLPALAYLPYALIRPWLFHRYGRLTPLAIGHAVFNLTVGLGWYFSILSSKWIIVAVMGGIGAVYMVMDGRYKKQTARTASAFPLKHVEHPAPAAAGASGPNPQRTVPAVLDKD